MDNVFVQEIYGRYQKAEKERCLWALLFGISSLILDYFGMKTSPGLALAGMIICIILAERCHLGGIHFLQEQINREVGLWKMY